MSTKKLNTTTSKIQTYYVDKIENSQLNKDTGQTEYFIKWVGFPK